MEKEGKHSVHLWSTDCVPGSVLGAEVGRNFLARSRCSVDARGVCCLKTLGRFKAGRGGSYAGERWTGLLGEEDAAVGPEGSA